ncbi:MAG TPA: BMP family ABC transporter substrate-binding protein [Spirochaetota bacterium]|nr:BMP family ABC transporter substrate-binding protein [Spirochaetota bacterium]
MKKLISAFLMILTIAIFFGGCGKKVPTSADGKEVVMGFVYVGPIGDGGWTYAHEQGRKYVEQHLGIRTIFKESVPEGSEVKDVIRSMIDQGATIIAATSFGYMDYVVEIAKEYPKVKFIHCSGYKMSDNMGNYFGRIEEPRYLSGIVAGLKTKTNKIGYVAAFEIPEVVRGINAFTLGVKSVNPKAEIHVRWTHTWYDPAREKEAAKALLDEKCDVIAQHQDTAGPQQAAEERGMFSVGYNSDMSAMAPKAYMTAPVWNWGPYYASQVKRVIDGTWKAESYWEGMTADIVRLAPLTKNAPDGAEKKVNDVKKKILDGTFKVFAGPIKDQSGKIRVAEGTVMSDQDQLSCDWFVEGVVGKIKSK